MSRRNDNLARLPEPRSSPADRPENTARLSQAEGYRTRRITEFSPLELVLTGITSSLVTGCLIFGFVPETWLAGVYLLPADFSGIAIEEILVLRQDLPLIRSSGHQISVILSVFFCLAFWAAIFGGLFRLLDWWTSSRAPAE